MITIINYQCYCDAWEFLLFFMNLFSFLTFDLPSSAFSTQCHTKHWKFLALCAIFYFFTQFRVKNVKPFGVFLHLEDVVQIFAGVRVEKQGKNYNIFVLRGGKNWNFWITYSPLNYVQNSGFIESMFSYRRILWI